MWYHVPLTVPAGTPEDDPAQKIIQITQGVITYLAIGFPLGCRQTVGARVYHWEHQIFPINAEEAASWDGGIEGGQHHYTISEPPYEIKLVAYSPTAKYDHTITLFLNLLPAEIAEPWRKQETMLQRIGRILGLGG